MNDDYSLLAKYILGELTPKELEHIIQWKNESNENSALFRKITHLRVQSKYDVYRRTEKTDDALKLINRQIDQRSKGYSFKRFLRYAAVIMIFISFSVFGLKNYMEQEEQYVSIVVKEGGVVKKISLDDGTVVWMNSGSTLRLPNSFSSENRSVRIEGEVYFDVRKNQENPFFVHTGQMSVKVLGTSFSINSRDEGEIIETILTSGKVVLQDRNNNTILEMSPGEKVTFIPGKGEYSVETIDVNVSTAWHLDQLTFESVTLREIVNKIAILYDVNVNLESKTLADKKFRCVINRDESLIEVLDILKYLARIEYRIEGDEVFINE